MHASSIDLRAPLVDLHVHSPLQKELHSFALEESALRAWVANPEIRAAGATLLDHAVARHSGTVGVVMHRPPHGSRRARRPEHPGDLAIRRHAPPGDPGHKGVDPGEKSRWFFPRPQSAIPPSHLSRHAPSVPFQWFTSQIRASVGAPRARARGSAGFGTPWL